MINESKLIVKCKCKDYILILYKNKLFSLNTNELYSRVSSAFITI